MQYTSTTWLDILVEQYAIYVNFGNCTESDWCNLALISSSVVVVMMRYCY